MLRCRSCCTVQRQSTRLPLSRGALPSAQEDQSSGLGACRRGRRPGAAGAAGHQPRAAGALPASSRALRLPCSSSTTAWPRVSALHCQRARAASGRLRSCLSLTLTCGCRAVPGRSAAGSEDAAPALEAKDAAPDSAAPAAEEAEEAAPRASAPPADRLRGLKACIKSDNATFDCIREAHDLPPGDAKFNFPHFMLVGWPKTATTSLYRWGAAGHAGGRAWAAALGPRASTASNPSVYITIAAAPLSSSPALTAAASCWVTPRSWSRHTR